MPYVKHRKRRRRRQAKLIARPDRTVALPPLSGPRHVAFGPDGRHVYLMNEMSASVAVFAWDAKDGTLSLLQSIDLLPEEFAGLKSGGALLVHPEGHSLYATTRSHGSSGMPAAPGLDQLVWLKINARSGLLTIGEAQPSGGGIPRSFALSPDARHLHVGHQCSGTVSPFAIGKDGRPTPDGNPLRTPVPVCLVFGSNGSWQSSDNIVAEKDSGLSRDTM